MRNRLLIASGALALALAACGGTAADTPTPTLPTLSDAVTGADTESTTTTTEAVDPDAVFQEYAQCMREHGVDMPDPGSGGGVVFQMDVGDGAGLEDMEAAQAECDPILEDAFGQFELNPEQQAEMADQELAFAECMRDEGIDWPDPDPSGTTQIELPSDVDPDTLNSTLAACSEAAFGDGVVSLGSSEATP